METFLQIWGGIFYLLNKIFLSQAEGNTQTKRVWQIRGWSVYLLGLPAIVAIFSLEHNWIAAAVEVGGAPSMAFGLIIAIRGFEGTPKWLDWIAKIFMYGFLALGVLYSLYDYGGITEETQVLEIGLITGYLVGTYLLAKQNPWGWCFFMLMNVSAGTLLGIEGYLFLTFQQMVSFGFCIRGFVKARSTPAQIPHPELRND